mgnify:CR=1 FL=1
MNSLPKKFVSSIIFNSSLFILLIIGIQNSDNKSKINFLIDETVNLPISFIIGSSFIGGSIIGSFFDLNLTKKSK